MERGKGALELNGDGLVEMQEDFIPGRKFKEMTEVQENLRILNQEIESKSKVLKVVEANLKEMLPKMKEYRDLLKGVKEAEVRKKKLESKVRSLEACAEERYEEYQVKEVQCLARSELLDKRERELELRIKEFEDRVKAFEMSKNESQVKGKRIVEDGLSVEQDDSSGTIVLQVELEGNNVHMLLEDQKINLSSRDEISKVLQLSGAPVLLVLEVIEVLYPPYLLKLGRAFEGNVGRSCVLLLEELIKTSPNIESGPREQAIKLAQKWKEILSARNSLEVLAFLYLLAFFDLAPLFGTNEVGRLFQLVAELETLPGLDHRLRLKDKIPGFIKDLIARKQRVLAVEYAHVFKLVHVFPPVHLLKQHVQELNSAAKKPEAGDLAISDEISGLEKVIKCILDHNLGSEYPPNELMQRVAELEARRKKLKKSSRNRAANEGGAPPAKKLGS